MGLWLVACHEMVLKQWFYHWIFDLTLNQRLQGSFFLANSEGFVSSTGFAALFFLGAYVRNWINSLPWSRRTDFLRKGKMSDFN